MSGPPWFRKLLGGLWLVGLLGGGVSDSRGFVLNLNSDGRPLRWVLAPPDPRVDVNVVNRSTRAVRYFLGSEGWSAANRVEELNAIRAAFAQWQSVPGADLRFEEAGLLPGAPVFSNEDNVNTLYWAKGSTVIGGGFDDITGRLAVTYNSFFDDYALAESDTVFNGVDYSWFTDLADPSTIGSRYLVEVVALHEVGHFIGINHTPVGGATMIWRGIPNGGVGVGLAGDDIAAVRSLYPDAGVAGTLGTVRGRVLRNGQPVFGAAVFLEDLDGNVHSGTVTRGGGAYELAGVPPGDYSVRAAPFDPSNAGAFLVRGRDIASDFAAADTSFLPADGLRVRVQAGTSVAQDLAVVSGVPPFRVTFLREPSTASQSIRTFAGPFGVARGSSNLFVGVIAASLPSGAVLQLTGTGVQLVTLPGGENTFLGRELYGTLAVAPDAAPGLRSFRVLHGTNVAYASGFLEVLPDFPDANFDGLDDRFQRRYFSPFTRVEAAPGADPDGDGFSNVREAMAGSDPVDRGSVRFKILSVRVTAEGAVVRFEAAVGRRFQIEARDAVEGSGWAAVGTVFVAAADETERIDPGATHPRRFYRVRLVD